MNKLEKLAEAIGVVLELLRDETNEEHSQRFYEIHSILVRILNEEKAPQNLRVFNVDYKGSFLTTVKAKDIKEAEEIACKQYPNISHSLQVWELGASLRETKGD